MTNHSSCGSLCSLQKKAGDLGKAAFDLTTRMLQLNPEFYTVWNYRREILLQGIFPTRYGSRILNLYN